MIAAAIPENDTERVQFLRRLNILDTMPEERFERLTETAMIALDTPMASVSLIDKERQWCKSSPGMEKPEVRREISFCGHTILKREPLVIPDTYKDPRFRDNPLVTNSPFIRAYIGIPLFGGDHYAIGSFCVLDTKPRDFSEHQIRTMQNLAMVVENEITHFALNESVREATAAREAAEAAERAKGRYAAVMSHEIRTPLSGIISIADLLVGTEQTPEQSEYTNIIRASGAALLSLINDFLDVSRMEAGRLQLENLTINIRRFLRETLSMHVLTAKARGIALGSEVSPAVPEIIMGDPFRLRQILLNLVGNALKFTREGRILVWAEPDISNPRCPQLAFHVQDSGEGIPPQAIGSLFQPFVQADNSISRHYGGSGLGLSICRQLVELMGGTIGVKSTVGEGTTFSFVIPFQGQDPLSLLSMEKSRTPNVQDAVKSEIPGKSPKILVVDDNRINQRIAKLYLEKLCCDVDCASDGPECLQKLDLVSYDIIFMDMQMPRLSGCDVTRQIRSLHSDNKGVPWIVALTASADQKPEAEAAGMNDYLTKPLRLEALRDALDRFERASHLSR